VLPTAREAARIREYALAEALAEGVERDAAHVQRFVAEQIVERGKRSRGAHVPELERDVGEAIAASVHPLQERLLDLLRGSEVKASNRRLPYLPLFSPRESHERLRRKRLRRRESLQGGERRRDLVLALRRGRVGEQQLRRFLVVQHIADPLQA
jgi:hypothetical protein